MKGINDENELNSNEWKCMDTFQYTENWFELNILFSCHQVGFCKPKLFKLIKPLCYSQSAKSVFYHSTKWDNIERISEYSE